MFLTPLLPGSAVPGLVWLIVMSASLLLVLDEEAGAVTNVVSAVARRPIALTARGRRQITLERVTAAQRRARLHGLMVIVAVWTFLAVFAVVHG